MSKTLCCVIISSGPIESLMYMARYIVAQGLRKTWASVFTSSFSSVQLLSHVRLFDPMNCSSPGLPVHHQLPELAQTHVHQVGDAIQLPELAQTHIHQVGDAIQPSHPLSSLSPPTFSLSQHQSLFQWVSSSHQVAKVLELQLQHQCFQWIFRTDFLWDWLVWSLKGPKL